MGRKDIQWEQSYVSDDKVFCVYISDNEELIREHAKKGDFPIKSIFQVKTVIDPTTQEERNLRYQQSEATTNHVSQQKATG